MTQPRKHKDLAAPYTPPIRPLHPVIATLRAERYAKTLSQQALAERLGYNKKTLRDWETGRSIPNFQSVIDWANALGFTITLETK